MMMKIKETVLLHIAYYVRLVFLEDMFEEVVGIMWVNAALLALKKQRQKKD